MVNIERWEGRRRANEILDRLNEIDRELEDVGFTFIEVVIDSRADDGLPPMTDDELIQAQAECDLNADLANRLDEEKFSLLEEFLTLSGDYPIHDRYGWREKFSREKHQEGE